MAHEIGMKWDIRFLRLAHHISQWSKDPSTKVGAVIVDNCRRIVGTGYNGFPAGVDDDGRLDIREQKYEIVVHAEVNAILNAGDRARGGTIYITPMFSCSRCAGLVIQSGIKRVVAVERSDGNIEAWAGSRGVARTMYYEAGVNYTLMTPDVLDEEL